MLNLNKFDEQRMNLNLKSDTFGVQSQKSLLITSRSEVPRVVREVSSLFLQVGHWRKFGQSELNFSSFSMHLHIDNILSAPDLVLLIPETNLGFIILMNINIVGQEVNSWNGLNLSIFSWVWLENKCIFNRFYLPHVPASKLLVGSWISIHPIKRHTTNNE